MREENYYLGLDVGTDSVGYAVTDQEYTLQKYRGKHMWGVHLFDAASGKEGRRGFRISRRRSDRRKQRVALLQELFAEEINKVDPLFYRRIKESALVREDAHEPTALFNDPDFTDKEYYQKYPTIHHLIDELMHSDQPHDVRFVYLACAWLVAHRGHFLSEISMENLTSGKGFKQAYQNLAEFLSLAGGDEQISILPVDDETINQALAIMQSKAKKTEKFNNLAAALYGSKKDIPKIEDYPYSIEAILKALCGSSVPIKTLLSDDGFKESIDLTADEDKQALAIAELGEHSDLFMAMKSVFDLVTLNKLLGKHRTISQSKIAVYEQHERDLQLLKEFIRSHADKKVYNDMFRKAGENNYVAYSYHGKKEELAKIKKKGNRFKATQEDFNKYTKGLVNKITKFEALSKDEQEKYQDMYARLEEGTFLPKQKTGENRVIPYQLYLYELEAILKQAKKHLPFLNKTDKYGSIAEKIQSVFTFRIPYYVGPLTKVGENPPYAWIVRKAEGKILPWNFDEKVDKEASEKEFIRRMLNTCTYLPWEKVLPKESLIYQKYTVLNEINNLKIDSTPITVEMKQQIYTDLYQETSRVTRKRLEEFLLTQNYMEKGQTLSGIDIRLNNQLTSYHRFKRLLDSKQLTTKQVERIIEQHTYTTDRPRFKSWLEEYLKKQGIELSLDDFNYVCNLRFKDFGRMSENLLTDFEGDKIDTGEIFTVMRALWETNDNFMQIIEGDRYTFREKIQKAYQSYYQQNPLTLDERMEEMWVSNAVKRPIIRALSVVEDVVKAQGGPPQKFFIEMTRGATAEQKNKRTTSRRDQIIKLYEKCKREDAEELRAELEAMGVEEEVNARLQSEKLFLYYMQLGRCLYTGEKISLSALTGKDYDIDHIYPQSYVKDDSIINNKVLVLSTANEDKGNVYPIKTEVQRKHRGFWKFLHQNGFMSEEKWKRLTRTTPFSLEEREGFIARQLTQTAQSTKALATLLKEKYPDSEIVYPKASLSAEFRQEHGLVKSRLYNDLHHAKDAYLSIVVGNVYDMKFTKHWYLDKRKKTEEEQKIADGHYSIKTSYLFGAKSVIRDYWQNLLWDGPNMLEKVKKTCSLNDAHMTIYQTEKRGGLFDQMPLKAAPGLIPRKANLPTEKYGGYQMPSVSFFLLVSYTVGKKKDAMFMSVQAINAEGVLNDEVSAFAYAKMRVEEIIGKEVNNPSLPLGLRPIKVNTVLSLDGFRVRISGSAGNGKQMVIPGFTPFGAEKPFRTLQEIVNNGMEIDRVETVQHYLKHLERLNEKVKVNPNYPHSERYDKVTAEDNLRLYDIYVDKLQNSVYSKRPNSPIQTLFSGRERFIGLPLFDQVKTLLNIHGIFGRLGGGNNLTLIGGTSRGGATTLSTMMSNWKKYYQDVRIIDSSPSGLWEKRSFNLLTLV
ncbi:MAG: type II CRISPR RNA-guided endonuclease Cas9 [Christensenellales bacterium]|jgi:CRISPR-associated endonuclease Csn1